MNQITIRNIPESVEKELRRLASDRRISLSKAAIILFQEALGFDPESGKKRDLSCIFGKWDAKDAEEFERNTEIFRKIDEELWQ